MLDIDRRKEILDLSYIDLRQQNLCKTRDYTLFLASASYFDMMYLLGIGSLEELQALLEHEVEELAKVTAFLEKASNTKDATYRSKCLQREHHEKIVQNLNFYMQRLGRVSGAYIEQIRKRFNVEMV